MVWVRCGYGGVGSRGVSFGWFSFIIRFVFRVVRGLVYVAVGGYRFFVGRFRAVG